MKGELSKKRVKELLERKGKVRGEELVTHASYIAQKKSEEGLRAVENRIKELGYSFKFDSIRSLDWYPVGYSPVIMIVAKEIFEWNDKDIFDMGYSAPKYSFLFKMALRWAVSIEKMAEESPSYWKKHYDFGQIESIEINKEKRQIVIRISGFKLDPIVCPYLQGYILQMSQYVIKEKSKIEERVCVYQGGDYEEYLITWEK